MRRLSRSVALSLRNEDYVLAARSIGSKQHRILFSHIVPNGLSPIIVQATLSMGIAVLDAAALGFLGLGQQPPYPEWGKMLVDSLQFILSGSWWVMLFPGLAIMLTVLGFNLLGDGLPRCVGSTTSDVINKSKEMADAEDAAAERGCALLSVKTFCAVWPADDSL